MGNIYLYRAAVFLTRLFPLSFCYIIAGLIADIQYILNKSDRDAVRKNLMNILNKENVSTSMVREVFHYFSKYLVDFFTLTKRINKDFIRDSVEVSGTEHLNHVIDQGKGGVLVSAHLGNWEMAGAVLSLLGYPLSVVALAHKDDQVNAFFNTQREFFGAQVIQTNVALRRCLEHLKRNRLVCILADRDFGHHGLSMKFFGKKSIIPKGAALFSLKTGAPIIPGFFLRAPNNKFNIVIMDPIYPPSLIEGRATDQDVESLISQYLHLIEDKIRQHPSQWLMFRPFEVV
jgi:KDO2-lipid IV(A) lauroyltransferase